jgi:acyl-CoA synthetase (AMP-forming)/AMP-acid ligase II
MTAYVANPDATAAAFEGDWFRTGDQGVIDADGYITITGRLKELINRGGEKISPREVDEILLAAPEQDELRDAHRAQLPPGEPGHDQRGRCGGARSDRDPLRGREVHQEH